MILSAFARTSGGFPHPDVDESVQGFAASGGIIYLAADGTDVDLYRVRADGNGAAALGS